MANATSRNPIFCDTAGVLKTGDVYLKAISWENTASADIAATDDILLSDSNGVAIIEKRATFDGDGIPMYHFPENYQVPGLTMTTIDGGVCYIYI